MRWDADYADIRSNLFNLFIIFIFIILINIIIKIN